MAFSLSRNARLYVSYQGVVASSVNNAAIVSAMDDLNTWQISILDGFSFEAATTAIDVNVSEAGATPVRGKQVFNTAIEPVNWSFSNYAQPRWLDQQSPAEHDSPDRIMFEALASGETPPNTLTTIADGNATVRGATTVGMTTDFDTSNVNELITIQLLFDLNGIWYLIRNAVVDQLDFDFSIDAIATTTWTGFGDSVAEVSEPSPFAGFELNDVADPTGADEFIIAPPLDDCIRNKLTTLLIQDLQGGPKVYSLAITGGSMNVSNNLTFLTPEALGVVNQPCGSFTGTRDVSGTLTAYLKTGANETSGLLADLVSDTTTTTQDYEITITVGGGVADRPVLSLFLAHANVLIPTHVIEDVVSISMDFSGLPHDGSGFDLESTNELTIAYLADEV